MRPPIQATLIHGGEVFTPDPVGVKPVFLLDGRVVGHDMADLRAFSAAGVKSEEIDATGCYVIPGLVDPHAHLVGTAGEQGWASRTLDIPYEELVTAGVTTTVGCLGTDDTTRNLATLIGRVRQLDAQGVSAYAYTGSFHVPPPTLTGCVRDDLVFVTEFLGIGELAIADFRGTEPNAQELARLASEGLVGGLLGEKAGVVHFHVGPGKSRLSLLRKVLEDHEVPARQLYPTHINRTPELIEEAAELARRGAWVDSDVIDGGAMQVVKRYLEAGGPAEKITLSSDAHAPGAKVGKLYEALVEAMKEEVLPFAQVLPAFTRNPADALKLVYKGRLTTGADSDVLVIERGTWRIRFMYSRGRALIENGHVVGPPLQSFQFG